MKRSPSPYQIRLHGARAFRNHVRGRLVPVLSPAPREPAPDETPLSAEEVRFGLAIGAIVCDGERPTC